MAVAVACFLLRYIRVQQAYDIFTDEITYARISQSVAYHHTVAFYGQPFYLHPPLVFFEQAFFIDAFHVQGNIFSVVYALRMVGILFAAGSAVLILRLGTRLGGTLAGATAALLFCLDPLLIRFDGRVFLEGPTFFWVLVGLCALHRSVTAGAERTREQWLFGAGAGLGFTLALVSNEITLPLFALPLLVGLAFGWPFPRQRFLPAALTAALLVPIYPIEVALRGQWHDLVTQQLGGIQRLLGTDQATGFNKAGAPSLTSRILVDLHTYAGVYAVLGVAVLPMLWFLRRGSRAQQLLALTALASYIMISYQITVGTLEEQMFYYVEVPAILMLALGFAGVVRRARRGSRSAARNRLALSGGVLALTGLLAFDSQAWVEVHTHPDAAMEHAISWLYDHAPTGTRVAPLIDTSQLLVSDYQFYMAQSPAQVVAERPAYVLTSSLQVAQGYGYATPPLVRWLSRHAAVAARYSGRTYGTITVWRLAYPTAHGRPPGFHLQDPVVPTVPVGEGSGAGQ